MSFSGLQRRRTDFHLITDVIRKTLWLWNSPSNSRSTLSEFISCWITDPQIGNVCWILHILCNCSTILIFEASQFDSKNDSEDRMSEMWKFSWRSIGSRTPCEKEPQEWKAPRIATVFVFEGKNLYTNTGSNPCIAPLQKERKGNNMVNWLRWICLRNRRLPCCGKNEVNFRLWTACGIFRMISFLCADFERENGGQYSSRSKVNNRRWLIIEGKPCHGTIVYAKEMRFSWRFSNKTASEWSQPLELIKRKPKSLVPHNSTRQWATTRTPRAEIAPRLRK
jgi:hypothetical protein